MRLADLRQKVDQRAQLLVSYARDCRFKLYGACVTLTLLVLPTFHLSTFSEQNWTNVLIKTQIWKPQLLFFVLNIILQVFKISFSASACLVSLLEIGVFMTVTADVAQSVSERPSELEGRRFDPRHSIDVCFDFPLFREAVALNTRKTEHWRRKGGKRCAPRATSLSV